MPVSVQDTSRGMSRMGLMDFFRREPPAEREPRTLWDWLLKDRIVFIQTPIDDVVANLVIAELLFLNGRSPTDPVSLYVNSPGGAVSAGLAILDAMDHVSCDVHTYCIGKASSLAAVIVAHGLEGCRYALPHARIDLGPVRSGKAKLNPPPDLEQFREALLAILARDTGRDASEIASDMQAERGFTAIEAIDYGLIDAITETRESDRR